jgi:hypothetical protein
MVKLSGCSAVHCRIQQTMREFSITRRLSNHNIIKHKCYSLSVHNGITMYWIPISRPPVKPLSQPIQPTKATNQTPPHPHSPLPPPSNQSSLPAFRLANTPQTTNLSLGRRLGHSFNMISFNITAVISKPSQKSHISIDWSQWRNGSALDFYYISCHPKAAGSSPA